MASPAIPSFPHTAPANGVVPQQNGVANMANSRSLPQQTRERMTAVLQKIEILRANGHTPETSPELANLLTIATNMRVMNGRPSHQPIQTNNGFPPQLNGVGVAAPNPLAAGQIPAHSYQNNPPSPVPFTEEQYRALKAQVGAFNQIKKGLPISDHILKSLIPQNTAILDLEKEIQGPNIPARIVDAAAKISSASGEQQEQEQSEATSTEEKTVKTEDQEADITLPTGPYLEDDVNSGIYPYNAYAHPFTHLKRPENLTPAMASLWATRLQRLLIPSFMPQGLDPHQVIAERNRYIDARMDQRIKELSSLPVTIGDGGLAAFPFSNGDFNDNQQNNNDNVLDSIPSPSPLMRLAPNANGKLRAIIELKALRVREKQRALRAQIVERLTHGTLLPLDRKDFRRTRRPTLRDARMTETLERKQRADREHRVKQKHLEQLAAICNHGREMVATNRAHQDRILKLGRAVQNFHTYTEKEEAKRIERISKERLKALKADDEEAYMKLIDTAKDTRITHLLRQTDAYLDSLAQAVVAQQNDDVHRDTVAIIPEDGPADETMFGAQKIVDPDEKTKIDYYAVAHRITEKVSKQPSILVGGTLKEYQLKGLQWMVSLYNNRLNGILADEMGLGKTIQTISLITFLVEVKRQRGPYLVIVPLSTMTNWTGEFAKWAPSLRTISYKGNPAQRRALQNEIRSGNFQVLLTTYEYIIKDRPILSKMKWVHMIIDEGHRMKNTQSKLSQTLSQYYHSRFRLILTGTPLQNNLPELWSLLNFVLPKIFNSVKSFDEWFNTPFANSGSSDKIELNEEEALLIIRRLHKVLRPFLLRRLKKDVESELPDKVEKIIKIRMSALQSQLYKQMKKYKMIADGKETKGKQGGVKGLSNELMQLRKICQHPFLFDSVEDRISPSGMIDESIYRVSGKFELLKRILPKFFATGHRVLIFFQMTKVMDIMEDFMKSQAWQYLRLDGGTKTEERASHVQQFNKKDSPYQVFILSTRAGGLGLNLQTADTVIIFDSDWNPHADLQAQDRAHRIGQTKAVRILRFITEKSVEEAMYARARYKLDIDDKVIQAGRFDNKSTQEEQEEFLRSILEADQEEDNEEAGDMNDEEINEIIARNDKEMEVFRDMDIRRLRDVKTAWQLSGNHGPPPQPLIQLEELPECYRNDEYFETAALEAEELEGRGHRRRNVVSYNDGLDDDAWAMALEGEEDLDEVLEKAREKSQRRAANKLLRESEGQSSRNSPAVEETRGRKKKGRPPKNPQPEVDYDSPSIANGKRKRVGKPVSVTPSIADDDEETRDSKRRKTKPAEVSASVRERMKKVFNECYHAVQVCEDPDTGRRRWELFKELPDRRDYPDYYQMISKPIAMSHLRKRAQNNYYKDVQQYRDEWRLMFNNARTYNVEGSVVYVDADEMEKVFNETFNRLTIGSGLPGAETGETSSAVVDDDDKPVLSRRSVARTNSKQILSDDEYLTPSDDD